MTPERIDDALVHYDELPPEQLATLAADPAQARRLHGLRLADAWLREDARGGPSFGADVCPSSGELYDYGHGPGADGLGAARRGEIDRHLGACDACAALVRTLASRPPNPILAGHAARSEPAGRGGPGAASGPAAGGRPRTDELDGRLLERILARPTAGHDLDQAVQREERRGALARRHPSAARRELRADPHGRELHEQVRRRQVRRQRASWRLLPLAAAAALLAFLMLVPDDGRPRLPDGPTLRGETDQSLLYPRERVLAFDADVLAAGPTLGGLGAGGARDFVLSAVEGAGEYAVEIRRHDGGAFERGEPLVRLRGVEPVLAGPPLPPGHYTWRATATVDGLVRDLGERDFEVVVDGALAEVLAQLGPDPSERALIDAVWAFHDAGFPGDARALVELLPPGPERDAWLADVPAR